MATSTYIALANYTVPSGSSAATITFSNIPATYRDLVIVLSVKKTSTGDQIIGMRFNGDTASNYSRVQMLGDGSSATSSSTADDKIWAGQIDSTNYWVNINHIMDYSATDKHKTVLTRGQRGSRLDATAQRWANTNAIDTVLVYPAANGFAENSSVALYGIVS